MKASENESFFEVLWCVYIFFYSMGENVIASFNNKKSLFLVVFLNKKCKLCVNFRMSHPIPSILSGTYIQDIK